MPEHPQKNDKKKIGSARSKGAYHRSNHLHDNIIAKY